MVSRLCICSLGSAGLEAECICKARGLLYRSASLFFQGLCYFLRSFYLGLTESYIMEEELKKNDGDVQEYSLVLEGDIQEILKVLKEHNAKIVFAKPLDNE